MRLRPIAIIVAIVGLLAGTVSVSASSQKFNPPKQYYLSLGDSLAYGYQQAKANVTQNPADFDTGYTDDFETMLAAIRPDTQAVNLGCPGETTSSFINGPCPTPVAFLHTGYSEPQLVAALAFLGSHPGQVSPITIDIGSNDALAVEQLCAVPPFTPGGLACVSAHLPALLNQIGGNLSTIVLALHAASPSSEIIVLNLYNPLAVVYQGSDAFASLIDGAIEAAATAQGARVADVFSRFNPAGANEAPTICALTAFCTALHDVHATDDGYRVMADALWQASGYSRLGD
jgi:lysophospholipase L1-like esterase